MNINPIRPPAVPLVVNDPYLSVWSTSDTLTDSWSKHWTGANQPMCGLIRIDGEVYRFMGGEPRRRRQSIPAMSQTKLEVLPTRTIYTFEAAGIELSFTFITPLLPHKLDILSRPVTYLSWELKAIDQQRHEVSLYFDVNASWVVNTSEQKVIWARHKLGDLEVLSLGSKEQPVLEKSGDDLRIDWGYLYLAVPPEYAPETCITSDLQARTAFIEKGTLPKCDSLEMPSAANARSPSPAMACKFDVGSIEAQPVLRHLALVYDDGFSVEYFHRKLRPYWRQGDMDIAKLLSVALQDFHHLKDTCKVYDETLMQDLRQVGGEKYALLAALSFRQCIAAHKLAVDHDGTALFFSKENFSNGCMATVDVTYPSSPFFLLFNPDLLEAQLTPILEYAASPRWKFPYAPHDIGRYPLANGQVYGGGETSELDQMPVEECGNMLILVASLIKIKGNQDYATKYWPIFQKWAEYLKNHGLDPENQLCTDDFAGHLSHNVNLSLKAIIALGAYSTLCQQLEKDEEAKEYRQAAEKMVKQWMEMAANKDHYRLTFDKPNTWSQKYNLVWDKILELDLFPSDVAEMELAFYQDKQEQYGLPLDNRSAYTKLDWIVWTATMSNDDTEFQAFIEPVYRWLNETPTRVPLSDWYWTTTGEQAGFQARSVVGGVYIKMLTDKKIWGKWLNQGSK